MSTIEEKKKILEEEVQKIKEAIKEGKRVVIGGRIVKDVEIQPGMRSWYVLVRYEGDVTERMYMSKFLLTRKRIF